MFDRNIVIVGDAIGQAVCVRVVWIHQVIGSSETKHTLCYLLCCKQQQYQKYLHTLSDDEGDEDEIAVTVLEGWNWEMAPNLTQQQRDTYEAYQTMVTEITQVLARLQSAATQIQVAFEARALFYVDQFDPAKSCKM